MSVKNIIANQQKEVIISEIEDIKFGEYDFVKGVVINDEYFILVEYEDGETTIGLAIGTVDSFGTAIVDEIIETIDVEENLLDDVEDLLDRKIKFREKDS